CKTLRVSLPNRLNAISTLELVVGISIFIFVITFLLSILVYATRISLISYLYTSLQEEANTITSLILDDIRNADSINIISSNYLQITHGTLNVFWTLCLNQLGGRICRYNFEVNQNNINFSSSDLLNIVNFSIQNIVLQNNNVYFVNLEYRIREDFVGINSIIFDRNFIKQSIVDQNLVYL
ncbi:MAG: hypothetical protein NZZ41_06305, partial [Candidatus Dojkabacteria bacterium]|nr:hypothetical protein [Candidatus Dojkabacteria bacterium]